MSRRGFTLLEVLLALALGAMLMLGVFSIMRVQTRLARDGRGRVEEVQLARAIFELMARDIRNCQPASGASHTRIESAAFESPMPVSLHDRLTTSLQDDPDSTRGGLPNLGIVGGEDWLILSPHQLEFNLVAYLMVSERDQETPGGRRGAGLQPDNAARSGQARSLPHVEANELVAVPFGPDTRTALPHGLVRFDGLSGTVRESRSGPSPAQRSSTPHVPGTGGPGLLAGTGDPQIVSAQDLYFRLSRLTAPEASLGGAECLTYVANEIHSVRFRYLDGFGWHSTWDGGGGLPQAIEIELAFFRAPRAADGHALSGAGGTDEASRRVDDASRATLRRANGSPPASPGAWPSGPDSDGSETDDAVYRFLVCVPTAPAEIHPLATHLDDQMAPGDLTTPYGDGGASP